MLRHIPDRDGGKLGKVPQAHFPSLLALSFDYFRWFQRIGVGGSPFSGLRYYLYFRHPLSPSKTASNYTHGPQLLRQVPRPLCMAHTPQECRQKVSDFYGAVLPSLIVFVFGYQCHSFNCCTTTSVARKYGNWHGRSIEAALQRTQDSTWMP